MNLRDIEQLLRPLRVGIANALSRAIVRLVDDSKGLQVQQLGVLDSETRSGCERVGNYGFTSHPHPGAEAVVLFVGGGRGHGVVVAVDDRRSRKKGLGEGEVAVYTDEGDYVLLKRGRIVEVKAGTKLRVDAPLAEITGNVTIGGTLQVTGLVTAQASVSVTGSVSATGAISDAGGSMEDMRSAYNGHRHTDGSSTTSLPTPEM